MIEFNYFRKFLNQCNLENPKLAEGIFNSSTFYELDDDFQREILEYVLKEKKPKPREETVEDLLEELKESIQKTREYEIEEQTRTTND